MRPTTQTQKLNLWRRSLCAGLCMAVLTTVGCESGEMSAQEALKSIEEQKIAQAAAAPKTPPKEAPSLTPPPPTEEELAAWDRKDPAGEAHLYKWDKKNLKRLHEYWNDLLCFRNEMIQAGDAYRGAEPGGPEAEKWERFKSAFIPFINRWQQRLFALEPRILEKSKFISNFLEAHEVIMNRYPKAYNLNDETELGKANAFWTIVAAKIQRYAERLGGKWDAPDFSDPKVAKSWEKRCKKAMTEPKAGKRRRRRGP